MKPAPPAQPPLASGRCRHLCCFSAGSYHWAHNLWGLIIYLLFLPVMLPSEVPRLTTDSPVTVFPGVWKLLSFLRLPSWDGSPSIPLLSLFLSLYFFLPPFEDNGLLFWVPDVFCQHSEVVLWNLLSVQMFFWWIYGGESGLHILFLCHVRTAPAFEILAFSSYIFSPQNDVCKNVILKIFL